MSKNTHNTDSGTYSENTLEIVSDRDTSLVTGSHHVGPLPSPESLAAYEALCPGAAREILDMTKENQKHRHKQENLTLDMAFSRQAIVFRLVGRGQWVGLLGIVLYFAIILLLAWMGLENAVCVALGAGAFYKLIGLFVTPHKSETDISRSE